MLLLYIFAAITLIGLIGTIIFKILEKKYNEKFYNTEEELRPLDYKDEKFTDAEFVKWKNLKKKVNILNEKRRLFESIFSGFKSVLIPFGILLALWGLVILSFVSPYAIEKKRIANQIKYDAIIFELKSIEIRDGLNIRDKDVFDDVIEWNTEYEQHKHASENIFFGVNSPMKIYEGMGPINVEDYFIVWEEPNE